MLVPTPKTPQDYIDRATACEQLADAATIARDPRDHALSGLAVARPGR